MNCALYQANISQLYHLWYWIRLYTKLTGKYEVQNQANAEKGCFPVQLMCIYTLQHITLRYKIQCHIYILNYFISPL